MHHFITQSIAFPTPFLVVLTPPSKLGQATSASGDSAIQKNNERPKTRGEKEFVVDLASAA